MPVVIAFDTNLLMRALVADNDEQVVTTQIGIHETGSHLGNRRR